MSAVQRGAAGPWLVRGAVLAVFVATLWFAGPRAWSVTRDWLGRHAPAGPAVELDRIALPEVPDWLRGELAGAFLQDLEPRLRGTIRFMDDAGLAALRERLAASPWLSDVQVRRRFPDRFVVDCRVRRPELRVVVDDEVRALATGDGQLLPAGSVGPGRYGGLPLLDLGDGPGVFRGVEWQRDPRIAVAAAVACEWREEVRPACPEAPELVVVDADNLGWRYIADARYSEVLVGLRRRDGGVAWFQHGRAHADGGPVEPAVRAAILGDVLDEVPGLRGLAGGDLRLRNLWKQELRRVREVARLGPDRSR